MSQEKKVGLLPVFDKESKVLILGSFPSVKSRLTEFYYGNKQNRFWRTVCGYFKESVPDTVEEKRAFLRRRRIALWDMVVRCEIKGSKDASVKDAELADLQVLLSQASIEKILLNGTLAYQLFIRQYQNLPIAYEKMPSTSPANPSFDERIWKKALDSVFHADG